MRRMGVLGRRLPLTLWDRLFAHIAGRWDFRFELQAQFANQAMTGLFLWRSFQKS